MIRTEQSPLSWILYGTEHCHLCEQAEYLLTQVMGADFCKVDIANCEDLTNRYGVRIPVLADRMTGRELNWPFDIDTLTTFISEARLGEHLSKL
jgi:Glutaredoxin-like domain (DUF836)